MPEFSVSDFQVTIVGPAGDGSVDESSGFEVNQHSRKSGAIVERIEDLKQIWDKVVAKLTEIAVVTELVSNSSQFQLSEIEFNIGIEAGLSVGLVTKGSASVTVKFVKR